MNKLNTVISVSIGLCFAPLQAQNYETDEFENFVADQNVQSALSAAQEVLCKVANLGTEELVNDGAYIANIYPKKCTQDGTGSGSSDGTSATTATTATAAASGTTAAATDGATAEAVDIDELIIDSQFQLDGSQLSKGWWVDDTPFNEQTNRTPKNITYIRSDATAGKSATSQFGDFELRYQSFTLGNKVADFAEIEGWDPCNENRGAYSWCKDGVDLGRGMLVAKGDSIQYKQQGQEGQDNLAANFAADGKVKGVYTQFSGWMDESLRDASCDGLEGDAWWNCQPDSFKNSQVNILGKFNFGKDATAKSFCAKIGEVYSIDYSTYDQATDGPVLTAYALTEQSKARLKSQLNWTVDEECYSIAKEDAVKNVWQYGMYNEDNTKYFDTNTSFPIKAFVDVDGLSKRVHGWASYWGVHVDESYQQYVTDTTEFKRDDVASTALGADDIYNVKPRAYRIEKIEKTFQPLDDLNAISLNFWTRDEWWYDEFTSLGFINTVNFRDRITFKTNKAVLTDYNNGSSSEPLTYAMYGVHDGVATYTANLVGAKIEKDNLTKLITNDPADPGKVMNFTMEIADVPTQWTNRTIDPRVYLCTGSSITNTASPYGFDQITLATGQECIMIEGGIAVDANGTIITVTQRADRQINSYYKHSDGTQLQMAGGSELVVGETGKFFNITKAGIDQDQLYLDVNFSKLFTKFGSVLETGNRAGALNSSLETSIIGFLGRSDTFTFLAFSDWINMFDHEGNRFNKIKGTFSVSSTPPVTVFVDDKTINESTAGSQSVTFSLSTAASSDVTLDYAIAASSTASAADYADLASTGTVTIAAGATSANLTFTLVNDAVAETPINEKITLSLSNPANAVLGRTDVTVQIFDDDVNRTVYDEYIGSYDAATKIFTVTDGVTCCESGYNLTTLDTPITFTTADWLSKMKKVWQAGTEYERTEIRELGVWSPDTETYYRIGDGAFADPTSAVVGVGVRSESRSQVSASDLPAELFCLEECSSQAKIKAHYDDALAQLGADYSGAVTTSGPSPFEAVGPYVKTAFTQTIIREAGTDNEWEETRNWSVGDYMEGQIIGDVYKYTKAGAVLSDQAAAELKIASDLSVLTRPGDSLRGSNYIDRWGNPRDTNWGIWGGQLYDATTFAKLECDKNGDGTYTVDHPVYTGADETATRYCRSKSWSDDVLVYYSINIETNKQYEIFDAAGSKLALSAPKRLTLVLPDTASFGKDAGKKFVLDYQGDNLGGIPGSVFNVDTGADLGEWVAEWQDNYRWVQRFVIPDGTLLTENLTGNTYKVKALRGEEWLKKLDSAVGSMPELLGYEMTNLLGNKDINFEIGPRKIYRYACDSNQNGVPNEYDQENQVQIDNCNEVQYPNLGPVDSPAEVLANWILEKTFDSCNEENEDRIATWRANNASRDDDDPGKLADWPNDVGTGEEGSYNFAASMNRELARCKTIGAQPATSTLINGGNPSVLHGQIVFDPSPSS